MFEPVLMCTLCVFVQRFEPQGWRFRNVHCYYYQMRNACVQSVYSKRTKQIFLVYILGGGIYMRGYSIHVARAQYTCPGSAQCMYSVYTQFLSLRHTIRFCLLSRTHAVVFCSFWETFDSLLEDAERWASGRRLIGFRPQQWRTESAVSMRTAPSDCCQSAACGAQSLLHRLTQGGARDPSFYPSSTTASNHSHKHIQPRKSHEMKFGN